MEKNLPERVLKQGIWITTQSRHFNFHYRPGSKSARTITSIVAKQERNYSEVLRMFHVYDYGYKIQFFIFDSFEDYDDVTGAGDFSSTYEIGNYGAVYAIDNDSISNVTGKHEITHFVVDNYFGFGAKGPWQWLLAEGLAVWAEGNWNGEDLYGYAARKLEKGEISSPYFIVTHPEAQKIQQNIYPAAGAFTKYMIDNYGLAKYINLYQKGFVIESFSQIFGTSFYEENERFETFLKARLRQPADSISERRP